MYVELPKSKLKKSERLNDLGFMKTIMMVLVVLCHSMAFFTGNWFRMARPAYDAAYLALFSDFLGTFHIQTFAMASGFLYYYLRAEKGRYNDPKNDIKKRAKRLLVPYLFTSIFWAIPIGVLFYKYSLGELFSKFILITGPAQLWFLVMLFIVFVFFELIGKNIKLSFKNLVLVYIITTIIGGLLSILNFNYFQLAISVKYILFFYLGGYIYKYKNRISWKQTTIMIIMTAILYALTIIFGNSNIVIIKYGVDFIMPLVSVLEVSAIYFLCNQLVQRYKNIIKNRFYQLLEKNSFGIYLFHQQIIYFTIVWFNGVMSPIVQSLLSFIIATGVSLLMSLILRKWKVTKVMFGL